MFRRREKRLNIILIVLLLIISLILITVYWRESSEGFLHNFQNRIVNFFSYLQSGVKTLAYPFSYIWKKISTVISAQSENEKLKSQIKELQQSQVKMEELKQENKRLQELLGLDIRKKWPTLAAHVIGKSPSLWQSIIIIDKGKSDGVQKHMAVVNADGLVGQVISASARASQVLLIIDQKSAVGAKIQSNRSTGIVEGRAGGDLWLGYISEEAKINKEDLVLTSGYGGVYQEGLIIGIVTKVEKSTNALYQEARLTPAVDFSSLEDVLVILSTPPEGTL